MTAQEDIELTHDDGFPHGFTLVDNRDVWRAGCRDLILRPTTLGVWVALASLPRGWKFREHWLCNELHLGRDALRRCLRELEESGRLSRQQIRGTSGEFAGRRWILHRGGLPWTDFPSPDHPAAEKPRTAKPPLLLSTEKAPIIETPTTDPKFVAPRSLPVELQQVVVGLVEKSGLAPELGQALLDELAHALQQSKGVARPAAYISALIKRAIEGRFVPDGAGVVAATRRREEERIATRQKTHDSLAKSESPEAKAAAAQAIAEMSRLLGHASSVQHR